MNSGSLETLVPGESLLVQAIATSTDKVQLEIAEIIETTPRGTSLLSMLNASDDRFAQKARRAWMSVESADAERLLGLPVGTLSSKEGWTEVTGNRNVKSAKALNILNPVIGTQRLVVQISETTTPTEYQALNLETSAKRRGAAGAYITHNGKYIFSNATIVLENQRQNVWLEADQASSATVSQETGEVFGN